MVRLRLDECCTLEKGNTPIQKAVPGPYPMVVTAAARKTCDSYQFDAPSVCIPLVSSRGHGVASLNQVYYQEGKFALGNILCGVTPKDSKILNAKFLSYYLNFAKDWLIVPLMTGGANVSLTVKTLGKVKVFIPKIEEQQRIVEILDKFTSLVSSLDSEIALRQKQYEFAGERIFCSIDQQYQWIPLGDVCEVFDGVHQTPEYVEKGIRFVSVENIDDIYGSNKYITEDAYNKYKNKPKVGDIFMTRITAGVIGQCAIVDKDEPLAYYVSLALLRPKKGISSRYLRTYLHSSTGKKELRKWIKVDATPTKINKGDINKVLILVPSFDRQLSIVRTLDTFESLLTNLKKERKLRQKQYEYYREKLLTFA